MTRPPEDRHPSDPPDLGRHYADRAERALRESDDRWRGNERLPDSVRMLEAAQAIALALLSIGERMARLGYAANRVHHALMQIDANAHGAGEQVLHGHDLGPDDPVVAEPAERPAPEPGAEWVAEVPDAGEVPMPEGWTPTTGESGAPRMAPVDTPGRVCASCQHDTHYAPGTGCQHPERHGIPF